MNQDNLCLGLSRIHVWRGEQHVLKDVSIQVQSGEMLHIFGRNGAGKSTLLRVMSGLLQPEQGLVNWRGRPIARHRAEFQCEMAYSAHEPALKGDLTALENLHFMVGLRRRLSSAALRDYLRVTGVGGCADLPCRVLSAGQRRRVAMARVLAVQAPLWLLDEPYANLDDAGDALITSLLRTHVAQGGIAVVVAHQPLEPDPAVRRLELGT